MVIQDKIRLTGLLPGAPRERGSAFLFRFYFQNTSTRTVADRVGPGFCAVNASSTCTTRFRSPCTTRVRFVGWHDFVWVNPGKSGSLIALFVFTSKMPQATGVFLSGTLRSQT